MKIAFISAVFHKLGTYPSERGLLNIMVNGRLSSSLRFFNIKLGNLSEPVHFLRSSLLSLFSTASLVNKRSHRKASLFLGRSVGISSNDSLVKTEVKKLFILG